MTTDRQMREAILDLAIEEYVEGRTVAQLSRQWGIAPATLTDLLKRRGVYQPGRVGGPARKTHCIAGHELAVHGKPATGGQGRYCSECKRIRERVTTS